MLMYIPCQKLSLAYIHDFALDTVNAHCCQCHAWLPIFIQKSDKSIILPSEVLKGTECSQTLFCKFFVLFQQSAYRYLQ